MYWILYAEVILLSLLALVNTVHSYQDYDDFIDRRSDEEKLLEVLFRQYNPSARPVMDSNQTVTVYIQFSLLHIQDLDVRSQILTATGLLILEWYDQRLIWNATEYKMEEIVLEAKHLWVPEFAVINGADQIYGDYRDFRALVSHSGHVHWEPGGVFKTTCQIDITYFPFDQQDCPLVFGAWSYYTNKMNLTNSDIVVNLDSYETNGEWQIVTTKVIRDEFSYECCPDDRFSNVAFVINLKRRYTFYVMNVILPSMVTSILLLSIFFCPPSQKVQIGVVVLLSFRIFLLNVTDSIPKTSDHIPLLGIYLTCTMAITTLSMVLTVLVLNLHSVSDRPVPKWVKIIVLKHLARLMCMCCDRVEIEEVIDNRRRSVRNNINTVPIGFENRDEEVPIMNMNGSLRASLRRETSFRETALRRDTDNGTISTRGNRQKNCDSEEPLDYSKEWHRLAEIMDRFFFWTFLLVIIAISLLLFHPLSWEYGQANGK